MRIASKRLGKELTDLRVNGPPPGIQILQADDLKEWSFSIQVLGDSSVFKDETFALRFRFADSYPLESPEVVFLVDDKWKAPEVSHRQGGTMEMLVREGGYSPLKINSP